MDREAIFIYMVCFALIFLFLLAINPPLGFIFLIILATWIAILYPLIQFVSP